MRIVVTHHNADLDALASMIAACKLYAPAVAVRASAVSPPVHRYLSLHKDYFPITELADIDPEAVDEVVVVDVRDRSRLRDYHAIFARNPRLVVYDHHPPSDDDLAGDLERIEPVGACVTLLVEQLRERAIELDATEATLMLLGIYADTGQLSYSSTTPRDVEAAAFLLRSGANLRVVTRYLEQQYTPEQRQLLVQMLGQVDERRVDGVDLALAWGCAERYVANASEVVDRVMRMGGNDAIFAVLEFTRDRRTQVIARSQVAHVDVGTLLGTLGGGGHAGAAAATFKGETLEPVRERLVTLLDGATFRPARVRDIMSAPVQTVDHATKLGEAGVMLERANISGMPVLRDGQMCGVLSRRDIVRAAAADNLALPVSAFMAHNVAAIGPDATLEDALDLMTARDVGRLPVVDGARLLGIVSRTDVVRFLYEEGHEDAEDDGGGGEGAGRA